MPEADKSIKEQLLKEGSDAVQLSTPGTGDERFAVSVADKVPAAVQSSFAQSSATTAVTKVAEDQAKDEASVPGKTFNQTYKPPESAASSGLLRHRLVLAATACLALSVVAINLVDLQPLYEVKGKIDTNFKFTPDPKPPGLGSKQVEIEDNLSEGLATFTENNMGPQKVGYADKNGNIVIPAKFIMAGRFHDGFAGVTAGVSVGEPDQKFGVIDRKGNYVVEPKYQSIRYFHNGVAVAQISDKYVLIDTSGKALFSSNDDLVFAGKNYTEFDTDKSRFRLIDSRGKPITPFAYNELKPITEGGIERQGYPADSITTSNNLKSYESYPQKKHFIAFRKNELFGLMDVDGNVLFEPKFKNIASMANDHLIVELDHSFAFSDMNGKIVLRIPGDDASAFDKLIAVRKKSAVILIDSSGAKIPIPKIDNVVIPEESSTFLSDKRGLIRRGKLYGYVDEAGREIIPPKYTFARPFHDGVAAVEDGSRKIYINTDGSVHKSMRFAQLHSFENGQADVVVSGPLHSALSDLPASLQAKTSEVSSFRGYTPKVSDFEQEYR